MNVSEDANDLANLRQAVIEQILRCEEIRRSLLLPYVHDRNVSPAVIGDGLHNASFNHTILDGNDSYSSSINLQRRLGREKLCKSCSMMTLRRLDCVNCDEVMGCTDYDSVIPPSNDESTTDDARVFTSVPRQYGDESTIKTPSVLILIPLESSEDVILLGHLIE